MKILRANPDDAEIIAPLFDRYRQFYKQASDPAEALNFLRARLKKNESVVIYAFDREAMGFAQLYPSFSSIGMKRLWILNDLFVSESARNKSVGRALLHAAAEFAKQTGARGLTLKTALDNVPAQRLYESEGWLRDSRFVSYDFRLDNG